MKLTITVNVDENGGNMILMIPALMGAVSDFCLCSATSLRVAQGVSYGGDGVGWVWCAEKSSK